MQKTTNFNLNLPEDNDIYNVGDFNENFEKIDEQLDELRKKGVICDTEMSLTSENPVQNKVVTAAINSKAEKTDLNGKEDSHFTNGTISFNSDGSVVETSNLGTTVTTFPDNNTIVETFTGTDVKKTLTTVFNSDNTITKTYKEERLS